MHKRSYKVLKTAFLGIGKSPKKDGKFKWEIVTRAKGSRAITRSLARFDDFETAKANLGGYYPDFGQELALVKVDMETGSTYWV